MNSNQTLTYTIHNFSDLCDLLALHCPTSKKRKVKSTKANIKQAFLAYSTPLPKPINYTSTSNQLIENLMFRAVQHWCCVSFKIVPIEIQLLQHDTPKTILYCIAAICITSINPENQGKQTNRYKRTEGFKKEVAYHLYKRARSFLKETIFEDEVPVTAIQSYFCLSYTANLLRLPSDCRTWQHLACETLRNKVIYIHDSFAIRQCWYRWYYIDAWMALAFNQDCLLPDNLPLPIVKQERHVDKEGFQYHHPHPHPQHKGCLMSYDTLLDFAVMTKHMRKYIRSIQQNTLPDTYDRLTQDIIVWWESVEDKNVHLANCYYSMRLVLIFYLLQHDSSYQVTFDLLLDGLDVALHLLQGLQELKLRGCDQSTYHHMFFAIHQTLKSILEQIRARSSFHCLEAYARQQFEMNLCVLEGTNAFVDDIYQMRSVGASIEADMRQLGFVEDDQVNTKPAQLVFRAKALKK